MVSCLLGVFYLIVEVASFLHVTLKVGGTKYTAICIFFTQNVAEKNRVRYFRGRVSYFNQSKARKRCFLAFDWLKFETLPRKYRTLYFTLFSLSPI